VHYPQRTVIGRFGCLRWLNRFLRRQQVESVACRHQKGLQETHACHMPMDLHFGQVDPILDYHFGRRLNRVFSSTHW
jgi:hypothetical protein